MFSPSWPGRPAPSGDTRTFRPSKVTTVPVVSTNISGIPELVTDGENGLLVAPRDAAGLADAVEQLLHDPQLRSRLGAAGRRTVLDRFDLEANARQLAALFGLTPQLAVCRTR